MNPELTRAVINSLIVAGSGLGLYYLLFFVIRLWTKHKKSFIPALFDEHIHKAGLLLFIAIILNVALGNFYDVLHEGVYLGIKQAIKVFLILVSGFFIYNIVAFIKDVILKTYERRKYKDYTLRSVRTKYLLIQRILNFFIIIIVVGAALMSFKQIREISNTLLASAGVAGIVLGFAAQKSLGSILGGIQIAIAQPVKLDDTIVIEDTFGTVAEITLTYVVVNTWDEKRLIVPINYFLDEPFENWTRASPEVIGQVKIYADYTLPIDTVRKEFEGWLKESPLWDKRKAGFLITDANDKTMVVRATMSAKNSDDAYDLECLIREKLITYIREHYPHALPAARINIKNLTGLKKGHE